MAVAIGCANAPMQSIKISDVTLIDKNAVENTLSFFLHPARSGKTRFPSRR